MDDVLQPQPGMALAQAAAAEPTTHPVMALDQLALNQSARVRHLDAAAAGQPEERARQLADIGFVPGEWVTVLGQAWPGGDPLVVRVGSSRFALRRAEAACVQLMPIG